MSDHKSEPDDRSQARPAVLYCDALDYILSHGSAWEQRVARGELDDVILD